MTSPPRKIRTRIGNPVTGEDFWPRHDIVNDLFDDLANEKGSRRLFGLRRIGKTSVLLEVERRLRERSDLTVVRIDVQGVRRFKDFLNTLIKELPAAGRLRQARQKLGSDPAFLAVVNALLARLNQNAAQASFQSEFEHQAFWAGDIEGALKEIAPLVLILDELPFMLRDMLKVGYKPSDVEQFLATLRGWRMNCGVRMLLSGSLGFAQLARVDGVAVADHIGDVHPERLPPLGDEQALALVEALARGADIEDWTPKLSRAIVDASAETWPIFLQCGFDAVAKSGERDPAKVKAVIESKVRHSLDETIYEQFATRLSRYKTDEKPARVVLKTIVATAPEAASLQDVDKALGAINAMDRRDDLVEALCDDDFLLLDTEAQTLRPASKLVPIWVRARAWGR
jgi:hypothetical protein